MLYELGFTARFTRLIQCPECVRQYRSSRGRRRSSSRVRRDWSNVLPTDVRNQQSRSGRREPLLPSLLPERARALASWVSLEILLSTEPSDTLQCPFRNRWTVSPRQTCTR